MAYLFRYSSESDYVAASAERDSSESTTSTDGALVHYDGVNVMIPVRKMQTTPVSIVVENSTTHERFLIPHQTYNREKLPPEFVTLDFICYGQTDGRPLFLWKTDSSSEIRWAAPDYYIITPDLSSAGSFGFNVNRSNKSWNATNTDHPAVVSWSAGATLASVAASMGATLSTDGTTAFGTGNVVADTASGSLRVRVSGYSITTMTLSAGSNATITDLSLDTQFNGEAMTSTARRFQSQTLQTVFGQFANGSGINQYWFPPATQVQYSKGGYNTTYRTGGNLAKFTTYWSTNGSSAFIPESTGSSIMKKSTFDALVTSTVPEEKALYDKFDGSYDKYMDSKMYKFDDLHTNGVNYTSYNNGDYMSKMLSTCITKNFNGEYTPAYPAHANAYATVDSQWGHFHLPTEHELAMMMEDSRYAEINTALDKIGGSTKLSNANSYWSSAEYNANYVWFYSDTHGGLGIDYKFYAYRVRPVLLLDI